MKFDIKLSLRCVLYALFGISLAVSISGALIMGALLLIFGFLSLNKESTVKNSGALSILICLLGYFLWGIFVTVHHQSASWSKSISTQSAVLMFFLLAYFMTNHDLHLVLKWFFIACAVIGILGALQMWTSFRYLPNENTYLQPDYSTTWPTWIIDLLSDRNDRAVGTRSHPLTYAETLMVGFFLGTTYLIYSFRENLKPRVGRALLLGAWACIVVGILYSKGRGVWVGCGFGFILILAYMPRQWRWVSIGVISAAVILIFTVSPNLRGRLLSTVSSHQGALGDQQSKSVRFALWKEAVSDIQQHPWTGVGLKGTQYTVIDPFTGTMRTWTEAHNIYLQEMAERGLVGFFLFILLLILIFRQVIQLPPPWRWGILACLVGFLISGITESWTHDKEIQLLFWGLLGVAHHIYRRNVKGGHNVALSK